MALAQANGILGAYIMAQVDSYFLHSTGILSTSNQINDSYGTYTVRSWAQDHTTWTTPTAGSDISPAAGTTYNTTSPLIRRVHSRYFPQGEMIAVGLGNDAGALEQEGMILGDNFSYNVQNHLFAGVLSGAFNATNGSLTGTHLYDMSSSAFKWSYVMKQANVYGNPGKLRYAIVHTDIAGCSEIYSNLDPEHGVINSTSPQRIFPDANYVGQLNGVHIFSTDDAALKASTVYSTYLFGDNSIYLDYQENPNAEIWEDKKDSGGSWLSKYRIAFGMGIWGLTYAGATPSVLGGATIATVGTGASWTKIASVPNNQISVHCVKTLIG